MARKPKRFQPRRSEVYLNLRSVSRGLKSEISRISLEFRTTLRSTRSPDGRSPDNHPVKIRFFCFSLSLTIGGSLSPSQLGDRFPLSLTIWTVVRLEAKTFHLSLSLTILDETVVRHVNFSLPPIRRCEARTFSANFILFHV